MTPLSPQQVCAAIADELEAHPERWAQHGMAFDAKGYEVSGTRKEACCWCLVGLVCRLEEELIGPVMDALREALEPMSITYFNDTPGRTVQEIIALCRRAAAHDDGRSDPRAELQRDAEFSKKVGGTL